MKLATNASAGAASSSAAAPSWRIRPSTITPTRSASAAASSKSCVTSSVGSRSSASSSASSPRTTPARVGVERRERLVEQQHRRVARERPGQRDPLALAAGEIAGTGAGEVRDPEALEQLVHPRAAAEGDVAADVEVREERVLLEDEPDRPPLGRQVDCRRRCRTRSAAPSVTFPRSGRSSPAIARSTLDFPAPDGPTSASVSRPSSSSSERRKERRGWSRREVERVHEGTSLTARRTAALTTTSSAPIASATSKLDVELLVDRRARAVCVTPWSEPANMIVAPNSPIPRANASAQPAAEAAGRERQGDAEEGRGRARAERAGSAGQRRVDGLERGDRSAQVERARDEAYRHDDGDLGERDLEPEDTRARRRGARSSRTRRSRPMPGDRGRQHERQLDAARARASGRGRSASRAGTPPASRTARMSACAIRLVFRLTRSASRARSSPSCVDEVAGRDAQEDRQHRQREKHDRKQRARRRAGSRRGGSRRGREEARAAEVPPGPPRRGACRDTRSAASEPGETIAA